MTPDPPPGSDPPLSAYDGGALGAGIDWADPDSRLAPFYLTPGGVAAAAVLGLALVLLAGVPLWHTDFWAHLAYGEHVAARGALPDREPLSPFTDKGERMFDAPWLTQLGYHALFRAGGALAGGDAVRRLEGGVELVRVAHLLVAVATLGFVGLACRRAAGSVPWAAGGMLVVAVAMASPLVVQRPQALGLLCFVALLCGLSRQVPSRRFVLWAPALLVLWANLHGSFPVGLGLIGAALLGRVIEVARAGSVRAAWPDPAARRLALALVLASVAVAVLNPYGPRLYPEVARFGGHPNLKTVVEWQPLDFSAPRGGHWGYLAGVALLLAAQVVSPRPFSPFQLILVFTLGMWPLFQQRAMAWWLPLVPWLAAPHLVAAAERWGLRLGERVPNFRRTALAGVVLVLAAVASPATAWVKDGAPRPAAAALHRGTPAAVAAALTGEPGPEPERAAELARLVREWHGGRYAGRVFASEIQGEYLVRSLPPEAPVMMFNHAHAFPADYWTECLLVKAGGPGWWEVLDRYRVGVVVVEADGHPALCAELRKSPAWAVALDEAGRPARDPFARLFVAVRRPPPQPKGGTP